MTTKFVTDTENQAIQLACEFKLNEETVLDLLLEFGSDRKVRLILEAIKQMTVPKTPDNEAELVKRLRQETDAGLLDCKLALVKVDWNYDVAKGLLLGNKLSTRFTKV